MSIEYLFQLLNQKNGEELGKNTFINQRSCPFIKYLNDKLSVKYIGKGLVYSDISVQKKIIIIIIFFFKKKKCFDN